MNGASQIVYVLTNPAMPGLVKIGMSTQMEVEARMCRVPDDCIDSRRYPLFMAREVMRGLIEQLKGHHEGVIQS